MSLLQVIMAVPWKKRGDGQRLIDHCRKLDGTEIKVVSLPMDQDEMFQCQFPQNRFACLQADGFHRGALLSKGKPFLWLETDSIPLKPGWLKAISYEYDHCGKAILLPDLAGLSKFDVASGIGVYPAISAQVIPTQFEHGSWDKWVEERMAGSIARSKLIQHSYGIYEPDVDKCIPHRFPRDSAMIRPETVLFHRDAYSDLITGTGPEKWDFSITGASEPKIDTQPSTGQKESSSPEHEESKSGITRTFYHTGCLGDIIAALPIMRQMGGGELVIGNHVRGPGIGADGGRPMQGPRFAAIKPLIEAQPYISGVRFEHGFVADHNFSTFRKVYNPQRTLIESQMNWVGVPKVELKPWITVRPSPDSKGHICIARTHRYRNPQFPWKPFVNRYGKAMIFLGHDAEYQDFIRAFGGHGKVRLAKTPDLLRMAELIAGSALFVGNQSVHCWIAMGLGHPLIQETWRTHPDSMVRRANARFVPNSERTPFLDMKVPL